MKKNAQINNQIKSEYHKYNSFNKYNKGIRNNTREKLNIYKSK
jgi:hypothetical protein